MADASKGLVFEKASMNTIHTSSIAHEILSYGSIGTLKKFIKLRFEELAPAGVWINRDVVGPDNKNQPILMKLNKADGRNSNIFKDANEFKDNKTLFEYLSGLSTFSKFLRFCSDFKGYDNSARGIGFEKHSGEEFISLTLRDACEFISKKDYLGNWQSEMHETFCFWELSEWKTALEDTGFVVDVRSQSYANNWILKNRVNGRVELFKLNEDNELKELQFPVTNMIIVGIKPR